MFCLLPCSRHVDTARNPLCFFVIKKLGVEGNMLTEYLKISLKHLLLKILYICKL